MQDDFGFIFNLNYTMNFPLKDLLENVLFCGMDTMSNNNLLNSNQQLELIKFFNYLRQLQPDLPGMMDININHIRGIIS